MSSKTTHPDWRRTIPDGALAFDRSEIEREIKAIITLGESCFTDVGPLHALAEDFRTLADSAVGQTRQVRISETYPLRTVPSRRYKDPDRDAAEPVYAVMTLVWDVTPEDDGKTFLTGGKASTRTRLYRQGSTSDELVASWRMELGDVQSPGSHFHVQIHGESPDGIFPNWLEVPRLPFCVATPGACVEFVLGELFQNTWPTLLDRHTNAAQHWRGISDRRLKRYLDWCRHRVDGATTSGWMALKAGKPPAALLTCKDKDFADLLRESAQGVGQQ